MARHLVKIVRIVGLDSLLGASATGGTTRGTTSGAVSSLDDGVGNTVAIMLAGNP